MGHLIEELIEDAFARGSRLAFDVAIFLSENFSDVRAMSCIDDDDIVTLTSDFVFVWLNPWKNRTEKIREVVDEIKLASEKAKQNAED